MGLYKREQTFMIVAAVLFLVGAIFMLINTFGNQGWALWVAFVFCIASVSLWATIKIQQLRFNKKYTAKESEIKAITESDVKEV